MKKRNLLLLAAITFGMSNLWALDQVDGVYQIANGDDLVEFAGIVNGGAGASNAVLTADIDMTGKSWTPIGQDMKDYKGHFNGQGHRIKNLTTTAGYNNQALFGQAVGGAIIENVIIDASCTIQGNDFTAGILGHVWGDGVIVRNCGNEAAINGTGANAAGIIGCSEKVVTIENCYNTGAIKGNRESAAICGWMGANNSVIKNCFNSGTVTGQDGGNRMYRKGEVVGQNLYDIDGQQATQFTAEQLASGELAYKLNGNSSENVAWYQKLGAEGDAHPYPFGTDVVYANGELNCDGTAKEGSSVVYANTDGAIRDAHTWGDWGFCTNCDEIQPDFLTPVDGFYSLGNIKEFNWFVVYTNEVDNTVSAKLTADIDFTALKVMIGNAESFPFKGVFDGQGHKVTVGYDREEKNAALFRNLEAATVKNLIVDGGIRNLSSCTGGIFAGSRGATVVENCVSYVYFDRNTDGDATFGGIGAYMHDNGTIRNCAFLGTINAPYTEGNGGILGYANGGANVKIENCLVKATISVASNGGSIFVRNNTPTNCFYEERGNLADQGTQATAAQLGSGEAAYLLNNKKTTDVAWYQVIGTDALPMPFVKDGGIVYAAGEYCDGYGKGYTNTETAGGRDAHHFTEWGFCDNEHDGIKCDEIQKDFMTVNAEGAYEIETAKQLNWFAVYADRVDATINGKLMNDLDVTAEVANFPGIASSAKPYTGTFDGQFYTLNINMDHNRQGVGFINDAKEGVVVKNLTITGSVKGASYAGAFIGHTSGNGAALIENCGNEATVTTTNQNAGGLLGCNTSGELKVTVKNSYNAGEITSGNEAGGLSGWFGNDAQMHNVYNIGTVNNGESFGRGNNIQLNGSSYDVKTNWVGMVVLGENDAKDGTLLAALADNVWHQKKDAHPVLNKKYDLDENFAGQKFYAHKGADVTFYRTTVADVWNTFAAPVALTAEQVEEVFGTGAKVAALKEIAGEVATFETVTATEAGKAYLVMPTAAKTTFAVKADLSDAAPATAAFQGVYTPTELTANDLFVAAGNTLQAAKSGSIKAYRAYFKNAAASGAKFFTVDGEANGIIGLNGEVMTAKEVYNLNGQRVNAAQKGVYIVNGKKVVM